MKTPKSSSKKQLQTSFSHKKLPPQPKQEEVLEYKCGMCYKQPVLKDKDSNSVTLCPNCCKNTLQNDMFEISVNGSIQNFYLLKKNCKTEELTNLDQKASPQLLKQHFLQQLDFYQQIQRQSIIKKWKHIKQIIGYSKSINLNWLKTKDQCETAIQTMRQILDNNQKNIITSQSQTIEELKAYFNENFKKKIQKQNSLVRDLSIERFKNQHKNGNNGNRSSRNNMPDKYTPDFGSMNFGKLPNIFFGVRYPERSQNCPQAQKQQFLNKLKVIKTKILQYLESQGKESPVLYNIIADKTVQAVMNTDITKTSIELAAYRMQYVNFQCFLHMFDWQNVQILKLVKIQMNDYWGKMLLYFIEDKKIETLVLTNNRLTEDFVRCIPKLNYSHLKNIYLGNNPIQPFKVKSQISAIKQKCKIYL